MSDCIYGINRVNCAKLLGVLIDDKLCFNQHVDYLIKICSQRFYLLQQMKKQGLSDECITIVFTAIVLSKLLYALPAWEGYISKEQVNRVEAVLNKSVRWGLTNTHYSFDDVLTDADAHLFVQCLFSNHCLNKMIDCPTTSCSQMVRRSRGHSFLLPRFKYDRTRKSFVMRALYNFK